MLNDKNCVCSIYHIFLKYTLNPNITRMKIMNCIHCQIAKPMIGIQNKNVNEYIY